jgi:trans-aconitate 2-methyltransferase
MQRHVSQRLIAVTAREKPFARILCGYVRETKVLPIDHYAQLPFEAGARDMVAIEKVYPLVLEDADAVVERLSGSTLIPCFERHGGHREACVKSVCSKLRIALPGSPVVLALRRVMFEARRRSDE